jgi:hypothetical protein
MSIAANWPGHRVVKLSGKARSAIAREIMAGIVAANDDRTLLGAGASVPS